MNVNDLLQIGVYLAIIGLCVIAGIVDRYVKRVYFLGQEGFL